MTTTAQLGMDFFFGGNAIFTIKSDKSGEHKTFKIKEMPSTNHVGTILFSVFLLTAPEHYTYLGITNKSGLFRLTKASKQNDASPAVKTIRWFLKHLVGDKIFSAAQIMHEGRCGRCGRPLTHPESILSGIGPECAKKLGM